MDYPEDLTLDDWKALLNVAREAVAREWVRENRAKALTEALTVVCDTGSPEANDCHICNGSGRDLAIGVRRLREYDDEFGELIDMIQFPAEWLEAGS